MYVKRLKMEGNTWLTLTVFTCESHPDQKCLSQLDPLQRCLRERPEVRKYVFFTSLAKEDKYNTQQGADESQGAISP